MTDQPGDPGDPGEIEPLADLLEVLVAEFREGGIEATLVPASIGAPAQIVVPIAHSERHLRINTFFLPDVDDPPVLQYFVTLPYAVDIDHVDSLARLLCMVNANLPLTGFELSEHNEAVVFRHTHAISVRPLDPGVIAWTWAMIRSAVTDFGPIVEQAANGLPLDRAAASIDERMRSYVDDNAS